ncbi:MAG TPA: hypothetical protein VFW40_03705 [Capsulimonadaceae bacterium]|nr:hypothetical protein [Capsulimonadaceae bacterium]
MFGFASKSPISSEMSEWIESSLRRFEDVFGHEALKATETVLPTPDFFPDEGQTADERIRAFLERLCTYMQEDGA